MKKGQQNRDLGTTNGFLTHMSWADGIHQRRRSRGKQWKEEGKYDGIRTLSGYKRRTSATQKHQPISRARPSIVKQLENLLKPPHLLLHSFSSSIRKETSQIFLCLL
ncbi:hypothetical protein L3X38_010150 [Prunus dulcis]|uniref:Uncharacterized protein n=1 Tax=Prunus dulcis TaxID=3755 RepID=A0AAD4WEX1_PRUDU|nr:hypothetical protein L3X38_010150 [Prunus dulcis]